MTVIGHHQQKWDFIYIYSHREGKCDNRHTSERKDLRKRKSQQTRLNAQGTNCRSRK